MQPADLEYPKVLELLPAYQCKGLSESAAFLNWFLENIFRLDDTTAQDSICDAPNDKGIDGIYVDHAEQEVLFFQSKLRQNPTATLGDTDLKEFVGSLSQFKSGPKIEVLLNGNANTELKKLLHRLNVKQYIETGYKPIGIFVANMHIDQNGFAYLANHPEIRLYGKADISQEYIDLDAGIITDAAFTFTIDSAPFEFAVANLAKLYLFAARASELINLPGISDATLFSQNVRLSLGNTDVNKQIKSSIRARGEHLKFPLFHNGITLLCNSATLDRDKLTVRDFVVVNGAQSLSALFVERESITSDLRLLLRVIEVKGNDELSRDITLKSNTQNAIKPRDMRSNHHLMLRLKKEFEELGYKNVVFEIKRGEVSDYHEIISNEEAGRLLLAFDLKQPYSCHQIYKVFDDFYAEIFGRPQVTASRMILLNEIMKAIKGELDSLNSRPFAHYTLTRFFILYVVAEIVRSDQLGAKFAKEPEDLIADDGKMTRFMEIVIYIIKGVIIDLNHETVEFGENFDYKSMLKNREQILKLGNALISSYKKDVARGKADTLSRAWAK